MTVMCLTLTFRSKSCSRCASRRKLCWSWSWSRTWTTPGRKLSRGRAWTLPSWGRTGRPGMALSATMGAARTPPGSGNWNCPKATAPPSSRLWQKWGHCVFRLQVDCCQHLPPPPPSTGRKSATFKEFVCVDRSVFKIQFFFVFRVFPTLKKLD